MFEFKTHSCVLELGDLFEQRATGGQQPSLALLFKVVYTDYNIFKCPLHQNNFLFEQVSSNWETIDQITTTTQFEQAR